MLCRKDPCVIDNQCKNGATCISKPDLELDYFTCICRIGFTGRLCETQFPTMTETNNNASSILKGHTKVCFDSLSRLCYRLLVL